MLSWATNEEMAAAIEEELVAFHQAMEHGNRNALSEAVRSIAEICNHDTQQALTVVVILSARYLAEKGVLEVALQEQSERMTGLFAEPRRIVEVLGLIHEDGEDGERKVWAVIDGPSRQAVRFAAGVDPEEVCPEKEPEESIWCWLIEGAPGSMVVAGRIDPPALLRQAGGLENEMTFEGVVEEEGDCDEEEKEDENDEAR